MKQMTKKFIYTKRPSEKDWAEVLELLWRSYCFCDGGPAMDLVKDQSDFLQKHTHIAVHGYKG